MTMYKPPNGISLRQEQNFWVIGCGDAEFDGLYKPAAVDSKRLPEGSRPHQKEGGAGTLYLHNASGDWYISRNYGKTPCYHCASSKSSTPAPPLTDWKVSFGGDGPAPTLVAAVAEGEQRFTVCGAGSADLNGHYGPDKDAQQAGDEFSKPWRQEGLGELDAHTLSRKRKPGTMEYHESGRWFLSKNYGGMSYYCVSTSPTPPLSGCEHAPQTLSVHRCDTL